MNRFLTHGARWTTGLLLVGALIAVSPNAFGREASPVDMAREHMRRGKVALENGKLGEACFQFKSATLVLPNWWIPHQEHLRCARILGEDAETLVAQATRILTIDNARPSLHFIRGILLEDLERNQEALEAYERALELAPWMTEITIRKGRMLIAQGQWQAALDVCDRALQKRPDDVLLLNQLATIYEKMGETRLLISVLEKLVPLSNVPTQPLARLAKAYRSIGNERKRAEVIQALERKTKRP